MKTSKYIAIFAASILLSANAHAFFGKRATTIKVSHYFSESNPHHIALTKMAEEIEEASGGELEVKIFPNATLGGEEQAINGVRNGTIEMALIGSLMQQNHPMLGVFEFPFLMKDADSALAVLSGDPGMEVKNKYDEFGVKHLAYSISGFRHLTSNKPVTSPKDYSGLRVRVPNNSMFIDMADALGWNVQALPLPEVYTALEQGVVDGQENPYALIEAQGFYEVQDYIVETGHMFTNLNLIYAGKKWDNLSQQHQDLIQKAADNYSKISWQMTTDAVEVTKEKIRAAGTQIIVPSEEMTQYNLDSVKKMKQSYIERNPWAEEFFKRVDAINLSQG